MADVYIPLTVDPNEYVYIVLAGVIFSTIFKRSIMSKIDSGKMISRSIRLSRYFCKPYDRIVGFAEIPRHTGAIERFAFRLLGPSSGHSFIPVIPILPNFTTGFLDFQEAESGTTKSRRSTQAVKKRSF